MSVEAAGSMAKTSHKKTQAKGAYEIMIAEAITTLHERKGASRQALWKCVSSLHHEADEKQFAL